MVGGNATFKTRRELDLDWIPLAARVRGGKKNSRKSLISGGLGGLELESAHHPTRGGHLHGVPGTSQTWRNLGRVGVAGGVREGGRRSAWPATPATVQYEVFRTWYIPRNPHRSKWSQPSSVLISFGGENHMQRAPRMRWDTESDDSPCHWDRKGDLGPWGCHLVFICLW